MGDYEEACIECSRLAKENAKLKRELETLRRTYDVERGAHRAAVELAREALLFNSSRPKDDWGLKDFVRLCWVCSVVSATVSAVCIWLSNL